MTVSRAKPAKEPTVCLNDGHEGHEWVWTYVKYGAPNETSGGYCKTCRDQEAAS